jgi:hypothetical protein
VKVAGRRDVESAVVSTGFQTLGGLPAAVLACGSVRVPPADRQVIPVTDDLDRAPPADPWSIQLTYRHRQPWWFDANSEPERWQVSADVHDDSDTHALSHVGDIDIVLVDIGATADPFTVLDGEDADLGLFAEALFDPATGQLVPELDELIDSAGTRLLILDSVRLTPTWRGFSLGVLLAGTAIKKLSGGARLAACYPVPLAEPGDDDCEDGEDDPVERGVATATLGEVWGQLGFDHFRDGVHVLDLNLVTLDESLERLRKQAEQQRRL